jgi:hypothetical protein
MPIDPYERAANAQLKPREYWGQIKVDAYLCVLVRGKGKVQYDPAIHPEEQARTAISVAVLPLPEQNITYPVERELIAESAEWIKIVWPSLRKFNLASPREAKDRWCKCHFVPTGRTYTGKDGVEKEATTLEFLELYADEAACRAAYRAATGQEEDLVIEDIEQAPIPAPDTKRKEAALEFVKVLVKQFGGDHGQLATQMAAIPMIAEFFTVDSPEVRELLEAVEMPF